MKTKIILSSLLALLCLASCTGVRSIDKRHYTNGFYVQFDHKDKQNVAPVNDPDEGTPVSAEVNADSSAQQQQNPLQEVIAEQKEKLSRSPVVKAITKVNAAKKSVAASVSDKVAKPAGNKDRTPGALLVIGLVCALFAWLIYFGIVAVMDSAMNAFGKALLLILLWICFIACALEALICLIMAIIRMASGNN